MKAYEIFDKRFVPPVVYKEALDRQFGEGWRDWEPETIIMEIFRRWSLKPSDGVFEKIMALQTLLSTDLFWDDYIIFEKIILAFNDMYVDPGMIQACTPEELTYGMKMASQAREMKSFDLDVLEYIRACHRFAGQIVYHPIMQFAQPKYYDDFRRAIYRGVLSKAKRDGDTAEVNEDEPVSVQFGKLRDCEVYAEVRIDQCETVGS